ncbi:DNA-binding NarL/FixJ family response regulator [Saccharomonospora amisosensis]|uniref:DNA-binding NarL/FixJ family response regulator n=1 Tax=Saccharomonospora amisosensis TaxID=1128677 RepID=A0A7X5ZNP2_9PSEU|nr:response regulator transcription factor [Saccharomonospora amisosensis]NIJ09671.1 DNA-binding NarL/FixJ family response regulator [Saccharomonospora amisosensis]
MDGGKLIVVIVDDHDLFTQGLALLLDSRVGDRISVAGSTSRPEEAAALVGSTGAELAIVDLAMPPIGGVAAIRHIKSRHPDTRILALSGTTDRGLAEEALRAGADGYLSKSADPDTLVAPLLSVAAGFRVLEPDLLTALLDGIRRPPETILQRLDTEEMRLWGLLARGAETIEIAERMLVSERTAKRMIAALLHKLDVGSRAEAAGLAGYYGLIDRPKDTGV